MKKRPAIKPISFEGVLNRSIEEIKKDCLQYRTVQIKIFENCEVRPPQLDPANMTDGSARATAMDTRLLGYIKEFAVTQDDVYLGNGQRLLVDKPKKTVLMVVSYPLYTVLRANGYVVGDK